jgi:hypothetical protein
MRVGLSPDGRLIEVQNPPAPFCALRWFDRTSKPVVLQNCPKSQPRVTKMRRIEEANKFELASSIKALVARALADEMIEGGMSAYGT